MKKIVFFDFSTLNYGGGCEKNFMRLGSWLLKQDYGVAFITATREFNNVYCSLARQGEHEQNISDDSLKNEFNVTEYQKFSFYDLLFSTDNRIRIIELLNEANVIYSRNEIFEVLILRYIFQVDTKKVVFGFHTPMHYPIARTLKSKIHNWLYTSNFYSYLLGGSKVRSLVLTDEDKKVLTKNNLNQRIQVIPNPIDVSLFAKKKHDKQNTFNIYFIGRMTEQKGIDTLANAIEDLSNTNYFKLMNFHFVGNGNKDYYLKDLSAKYPNCHFLGFKTEIISSYQAADITIVPSRWEGFPYSVLEAQSCGVPVITTNIPGCVDIVKDKITGWIIPSNGDNLSQFIISAFLMWRDSYHELETMGDNARKNVIANYTEEVIDKKIEKFLFDI